jgi:hypothetical protein
MVILKLESVALESLADKHLALNQRQQEYSLLFAATCLYWWFMGQATKF